MTMPHFMNRRPRDLRRAAQAACLAAAAFGALPPAGAACVAGHALEPDSSFPSLPGRVVYHAYVSYGDGSSHLYLYNFATRARTQLDLPAWNIADPMNADFSPDGRRIVFMGRQGGDWNVFAWTLGSAAAPSKLSASLGGRNEDPKFSFDGTQVVIKHEGDLLLGKLALDAQGGTTVTSWQHLTDDAWTVEESMPFLSADGSSVFYTAGAGADMRIWRKDLSTGQAAQFVTPPAGARDYYPVVRDADTYFFTRVMPGSGNDQLMKQPTDGSSKPKQLSINDCKGNNSDAAPTGKDFLIFSSTAYDGDYALMLGKLGDGKVWHVAPAIVDRADGKQKLGARYTATQ